jgi:hypothetical protein
MIMHDRFAWRRRCSFLVLVAGLLMGWGISWAIEYVESSVGLGSPIWEGGDSELEFGDINGDGNGVLWGWRGILECTNGG